MGDLLDPYADAVRFIERLLGPCDPGPGGGDHAHRQCRRCLAIARLEVHDRFARRCLRTAQAALQQVMEREQPEPEAPPPEAA